MIGRKRGTLGVDYSSHSIKWVALSKGRGRVHVEHAAIQDCRSLVQPVPETDKTSEDMLKQLSEAQKLNRFDTVINLPDSAVFTDEITLPPIPPSEMPAAIISELSERLPFPADEAVVDYLVVGSEVHTSHTEQIIRAFCASDARASDLHRIGTAAGLRVTALEPDLLANLAVLAYNQYITDKSTNLLLDIGSNRITLALISKKRLMYCSTLTKGLDEINSDLTNLLGMSHSEAEEIKATYSLADLDQPPTEALKIIDGRIYDMLYRIDKLIGYLGGILKNENIESLLLLGGGACIEGIDTTLEGITSIPAFVVNPFKNIDLHQSGAFADDKIASHAPQMCVAVGLALRGL